METINAPLFCMTGDQDWASDAVIADFVDLFAGYGIRPTLFATNKSSLIDELAASGKIEIGLHPNFLPGSTHGTDAHSVIKHMMELYPSAQTFRSHCFVDGSPMCRELYEQGIRYDSNLSLDLQPNIVPLRHASGITRFPVFWNDYVHVTNRPDDWELQRYVPAFFSPGLKVFNFHPVHVAANVPNSAFYQTIRARPDSLSAATIETVRYKGPGVRTFLIALLEQLKAKGAKCYTLAELHDRLPIGNFMVPEDETKGRATRRTEEEAEQYRKGSEAEKQALLKKAYDKRNASDVYATSRDSSLRELEIDSLRQSLPAGRSILDLGCGNGYTLLSLARSVPASTMTGVDFAPNLIEGAKAIKQQWAGQLRCEPEFICDDAVAHIQKVPEGSWDVIITERFLLNLPSLRSQQEVIRAIYRALTPGGTFLMCEGSEDGHEYLNQLREKVGLAVIPRNKADNISARRFHDCEVERFATSEIGFRLTRKLGYSTYFLIARVLHPLLVRPQEPRFDAKINEFAMKIQQHTSFSPGYGSNVLWVFEK
jgi:ubiquinone/menaquinone biosynthesis C-methylase UbiE